MPLPLLLPLPFVLFLPLDFCLPDFPLALDAFEVFPFVLDPTEGALLANTVGAPEGEAVGAALGENEGASLGASVGGSEGAALGESVGEALGDALGEDEGASLGDALGEVVGAALGDTVGESVGGRLLVGLAVSTTTSPSATSVSTFPTLKSPSACLAAGVSRASSRFAMVIASATCRRTNSSASSSFVTSALPL